MVNYARFQLLFFRAMGSLGRPWVALGISRGTLGTLLGRSWVARDPPVALLGHSGLALGPPWRLLGRTSAFPAFKIVDFTKVFQWFLHMHIL